MLRKETANFKPKDLNSQQEASVDKQEEGGDL
jgi:hypothetical protein